MSQVHNIKPPPPPPPPLLTLTVPEFKLNPKILNTSELITVDENALNLSVKRFLSLETKLDETFYLINTNLKPQLQDGPKCGLVALSIATSLREKMTNVNDIFEMATSLGLTRQGEMFSTNSLALLAEKYNFKTQIITGGLNAHLNCILNSLLRKCLLLVPYDADFNHAPCCKKGLKAHWAVITGFVIFTVKNSSVKNKNFVLVNPSNSTTLCQCSNYTDSINSDLPLTISLYQEKILIGKGTLNETYDNLNEGKIYLIGMQGKSRHIGFWLFDDLSESNNNLISFPMTEDSDYVFPDGGIEEGLKGKAIILHSCSS